MITLKKLTFRSFFLFEQMELEPSQGLNIITGESGAGKSLFLEGINLLLGGRLDASLVAGLQDKAVLEAVFECDQNENVKEILEENELDDASELIIRREFSPAGKNRCFINDTPVTVQSLKSLGEKLCEVHSQHETYFIKSNEYQIGILDVFAKSNLLRIEFKELLNEIKKIKNQVQDIEARKANAIKEQEFNNYLINELKAANLVDVAEEEMLEEEQKLLANAADIVKLTEAVSYGVEGSEHSLDSFVAELRAKFKSLTQISHLFEDDYQRFESAWIELKEVARDINRKGGNISVDSGRLQEVEDRLGMIQNLKRKHGVTSIQELVEIKTKLTQNALDFESLESKLHELLNQLEVLEANLLKKASEITALRRKHAPLVSNSVKKILAELEIPSAEFIIKIEDLNRSEWTHLGPNEVTFLFSANAGVEPQKLESVASGGELSRLMLSFKTVAEGEEYVTIFDEIDTGVSGETAMKVGKLIAKMGQYSQLFVITHLPQVASKGNSHFLIKKSAHNDKSVSAIENLQGQSRVLEVARLLSGKEPGEKAIKNAEELLKTALS
ncbi:MAG: DNA repair protein RecN [Bacteroidia bacterium]|nr:DNA repair protein RecN [Bacteroidia bacterium]